MIFEIPAVPKQNEADSRLLEVLFCRLVFGGESQVGGVGAEQTCVCNNSHPGLFRRIYHSAMLAKPLSWYYCRDQQQLFDAPKCFGKGLRLVIISLPYLYTEGLQRIRLFRVSDRGYDLVWPSVLQQCFDTRARRREQ